MGHRISESRRAARHSGFSVDATMLTAGFAVGAEVFALLGLSFALRAAGVADPTAGVADLTACVADPTAGVANLTAASRTWRRAPRCGR